MSGVFIKTSTRKEAAWLLAVIRKMQFTGRIADVEELEDMALLNAIKKGETGKYVDTGKFRAKLRGK